MRTSAAGTSTEDRGFTLVELAVVLVILGIVATLVLPRLSGFGGNRLERDAQRLATTIKALYSEAALSGETHLLVVRLDEGSYQVRRLVNKGDLFEEQTVGETRQLGDEIRFRDVWVRGVGALTSGEIKVHAYPVGWMDESAFHLQESDGRVLTVHVPPLAGMADIYEEDRSF